MIPTGKWVMVANYNGGNFLSAFPVEAPTVHLGASRQLIQHEGKGANPRATGKGPQYIPCFYPGPTVPLLTPDLGLDKVYVYDFSPR